MKKTISLFAAALMVSTSAFALSWNPEPSSEQHLVGVTIGWMDKTMKTNGVTRSLTAIDNQKLGNTLQVGLTITPEFKYGIGLQAGVYYEWTGNSAMEDFTLGKLESRINNHEISIPVRLQWRYEILNGVSLFAFTGPSFDIGLIYSERYKLYDFDGALVAKGFINDYSGSYNIDGNLAGALGLSGEGKNDNVKAYKPFHPYWGFGVGFQWEYLRLQITSDWGIMNVSNNTKNVVYYNKPIAISFSYLF